MFEQYNQALIAASYGQLSLSADVAVLPEASAATSIPSAQEHSRFALHSACDRLNSILGDYACVPPGPAGLHSFQLHISFQLDLLLLRRPAAPGKAARASHACLLRHSFPFIVYLEGKECGAHTQNLAPASGLFSVLPSLCSCPPRAPKPAPQALEAAGEDPWMWFILAPLALHQVPPFRAWSGGRSAGVSLQRQVPGVPGVHTLVLPLRSTEPTLHAPWKRLPCVAAAPIPHAVPALRCGPAGSSGDPVLPYHVLRCARNGAPPRVPPRQHVPPVSRGPH